MSDSVANLTVKVDTKSVAAAIAALDKLAVAAAAVEKSVTRIGREAAKPNAGTKPLEENAKKTEGAFSKLDKQMQATLQMQRKIEQATTRVAGVVGRANRQLSAVQARDIDSRAQTALNAYIYTLKQYGVNSLEAVKAGGAFNRTTQALSGEIAKMGGLLTRVSDNARVFSAAFGAANASLGGFSRVLFNTLPAVQALLGAFALREITQSIMEFERFTNTLKTVSGSTGEFNRNLGFLFAEAERIGFAVGEVGNSFARLSLAMKGAGFSADESKNSFSLLAEASRNFGLSSADTMGVIRALEQSMSKGKFMAEEVRLQLGDRLPIAMAALERAVTKVDGKQADLNKRFEEGSIDVKRYGLEFIRQINAMSGGAEALSRTQNSVAAALGRLNNELVLVATTFGEGGFTNAIIIATQNFIDFLKTLRQIGVISAAGAAMEALAKQTALLTAAVTGLATALSVGLVAKIARFAFTLSLIGRIAAAIGVAITAAVALTGAFNAPQRALNDLTAAGNDFNRAFEKSKGASEEFRTSMTTMGAATRSATTEIEKKIDVLRKLGLSEIEVTRVVGEETLKRMALAEKEMEQQLKVMQDAISVRRNAALTENAGVARLLAVSAADEGRIAELTKQMGLPRTTAAEKENLQLQINRRKEAAESYKDLVGILRDYIGLTLDEATALKRLEAEREKHPTLVDAIRTAILSNRDTLDKETAALKNNLDRLKENRREREAIAQMAAQPEIVQASIRLEEMGGSTALRDASGAKKMLDTFNESLKQFQEKYGDNKFTSQMKDIEKVVIAAGQKLEYFGISSKMMSSDVLVALASNEMFAKSFPEMTTAIKKFAEEIENARSPLRDYFTDLYTQIEQNQKLIDASKKGATAFKEAEVAVRAENKAREISARTGVDYKVVLDSITPTIQAVAKQEEILADFRKNDKSTEKMTDKLKKYTSELEIEINAHQGVIDAYKQSTLAGEEMELQIKAQTKALDFGKEKTDEYKAALKAILPLMRERKQQERTDEVVKANTRLREEEIAVLEKERELIGASTLLREQELAILKLRQQYRGASPDEISALETTTRKSIELRQQNDRLDNSYKEMANIGVRAFEQVGDAITEAFAKGEIRALNFGNVIRGVMSSIVQSILRLGVVNPIINSIFSGTALPTLGLGISAMGGAGAAARGAGVGFGDLLGVGSLFGGGGGGGLSTFLFGASAPLQGPSLSGAPIASGMQGVIGSGGNLFGIAGLNQFIGGVGIGAGIGGFTANLMGGNSTYGSIGGAAGAALGQVLIPIPGVGAAIGAIVGGGLGGLFGPGESDRGFGYAVRGQNGRLAMTDMFYNEQGRAQFQEAEAGINAINAYLQQRGLSVTGDRAVGGNRFGMGNLGYGEAASFSEAIASMNFAATANDELNRALSGRSFAGLEKLQGFVEGFISIQDTIKGLTEDPIPEFTQQMDALIDSFAQAAAKAREYGISEDDLNDARDAGIAKLEKQRALTIRDTALGLEIRRLTALGLDQQAEQIQLSYNTQKEIESFTASLDALALTAEEKSKMLVKLEEVQAEERAAIMRESTKGISDFLDSLRVGGLSGTTGMGRLASAGELFSRDLAAAQTGDRTALQRITQSSETYLNLAREIYGSTSAFHGIRSGVVSSLENLVSNPVGQQLLNISDVPFVKEMAGLGQTAFESASLEYNKQFNDKLESLLPIAEAIKTAVEKTADVQTYVAQQDFMFNAESGAGGFGGDMGGGGGMMAAMGAALYHGKVMAYANGGIPDYVNSPTLAPMALFGEAGPEAIMPLRRGPDGRLGVEVNGGNTQAVVGELRAVRNAIESLEETVARNDADQGSALLEAVSGLQIQIGELREELRTSRLRAQ